MLIISPVKADAGAGMSEIERTAKRPIIKSLQRENSLRPANITLTFSRLGETQRHTFALFLNRSLAERVRLANVLSIFAELPNAGPIRATFYRAMRQ